MRRLRVDGWLPLALWSLVLTLLTWQELPAEPGAGLDFSWQVGLGMAHERGFDFGTDLIFTFGPLGFLHSGLAAFDGQALPILLYALASRLALCAAVLWLARTTFSWPVSLALALLAAAFIKTEPMPAAVFACCAVALLAPERRSVAVPLVVWGGGIVAALELLTKVNTGILIGAMLALTVLGLPGSRARNVAGFAVSAVASFVTLWFAAGQSAANLDDYARGAFEVASGYTSAMANAVLGPWAALIGALVGIGLVIAALRSTWDVRGLARWAFVAVLAAYLFAGYKHGFVRADEGHTSRFFAGALVPLLALPLARAPRHLTYYGFAAMLAMSVAAYNFGSPNVRPFDQAGDAISDIGDFLDAGRRSARIDARRAELQSTYALDDRILELIAQEPVHIAPWEASIAWAYELNWDPLPTLQSYASYTSWLDELDAERLISGEAPTRILRHALDGGVPNAIPETAAVGSVDFRFGPADGPAAAVAMLCNYRELYSAADYQLLGRTEDRCGAETAIGSQTTTYGQAVEVPQAEPGSVVIARIDGLEPGGLEALESLVYRPSLRHVTFDALSKYRIVPAVADDGIIVDSGEDADFLAPFSLSPDAETITFEKEAPGEGAGEEIEIEFASISVAAAG